LMMHGLADFKFIKKKVAVLLAVSPVDLV
jgi:hypothetical protein